MNRIYNKSANKSPERPWDKIMIQVDNNVPPLQSNATATYTASLGTTGSQNNAAGTYVTVSENTTKEMNERFEAEFLKMKQQQEIQTKELENKLRLEIEASVTTGMKNSIQNFSRSM
eukprot:1608660-Ditylum_brightwellii.AAC.1